MCGCTRTSGVMTLEARVDALAALGLVGGERGGPAGWGRCRWRRAGAGAGPVAAHVVPGPAVEAAFLDGGHVVGDQVVAEVVALVGGAPERAGDGVDGLADAVADAGGVDLDEFAFGRVLEHVGAVELLGVRVGVVDVGAGADGDEHVLAVFGEDDVAGPVAAAGELRVAGNVGDDGFRRAGGVQVAGVYGMRWTVVALPT
jgi:hypothetical protein